MVKKEEFYFDSRDNSSKIHAVKWIPEGKISAILQIVHGMAEYVERYDEFARYLAKRGILVTGEDHLGHGQSVGKDGVYGYFCERDAATVLVRDVHRLKKMVQEEYPGVPYMILGHSMGSFILRNYLCRYGNGINGAIVVGTGMPPKGLIACSKVLCRILGWIQGQTRVSYFLDKMAFGSYNDRIEDLRTQKDWLCTDPAVVDAYINDPLCGFTFTVNGFETMFELIARLHQPENLINMPTQLPTFFIYGKQDPVGEYGEGVERILRDFAKLGMKAPKVSVYENDRHEVLNEKDKIEIFEEIYEWIEQTGSIL